MIAACDSLRQPLPPCVTHCHPLTASATVQLVMLPRISAFTGCEIDHAVKKRGEKKKPDACRASGRAGRLLDLKYGGGFAWGRRNTHINVLVIRRHLSLAAPLRRGFCVSGSRRTSTS